MDNARLEALLRDTQYDKPSRCSKCGSFLKYTGLGEYRCDSCGYKEYDSYGSVRAYVEANPGATVLQIEAATGVSQKLIHQMVSDGKFEIRNSDYLKGGNQNEEI